MNLNKHFEFFNPFDKIKWQVHIIGCGALGGYTAEQLAKLGIQELHLWDFDTVEEHNITNQVYTTEDVGLYKDTALQNKLEKINPNIKVVKHERYEGQMLQGYVFLCVDSIKVRRLFYESNQYNDKVLLVIDERIALTSGQVYTAPWTEYYINRALESSDFEDDEVSVEVSACGTTLSVSPSVLLTISYGIASFINFLNGKEVQYFITFDAFEFKTRAYK